MHMKETIFLRWVLNLECGALFFYVTIKKETGIRLGINLTVSNSFPVKV